MASQMKLWKNSSNFPRQVDLCRDGKSQRRLERSGSSGSKIRSEPKDPRFSLSQDHEEVELLDLKSNPPENRESTYLDLGSGIIHQGDETNSWIDLSLRMIYKGELVKKRVADGSDAEIRDVLITAGLLSDELKIERSYFVNSYKLEMTFGHDSYVRYISGSHVGEKWLDDMRQINSLTTLEFVMSETSTLLGSVEELAYGRISRILINLRKIRISSGNLFCCLKASIQRGEDTASQMQTMKKAVAIIVLTLILASTIVAIGLIVSQHIQGQTLKMHEHFSAKVDGSGRKINNLEDQCRIIKSKKNIKLCTGDCENEVGCQRYATESESEACRECVLKLGQCICVGQYICHTMSDHQHFFQAC
jgi:hypothetical protein